MSTPTDQSNTTCRLGALLAAAESLREALIAGGEPELADRLAASVIGPLGDVAFPDPDGSEAAEGGFDALWRLTEAATRLRVQRGGPAELLEATAALQLLAVELDPDRASTLRALHAGLTPCIQPAPNGPLLITNVDDLHDCLGVPIPTLPQMALCRCGASATKPFCDGTHATIGFRDAKDAERIPDRRDTYVGLKLAIDVTKDGPYRVTGAIELPDPNGVPFAQNEPGSAEHYAFCRCGQSRNKPFCSGMHWYIDFQDPEPDLDSYWDLAARS